MIKPLLVNTYDAIGGAGAARAAYRLHQGLLRLGIDSKMLVQDKKIDDATVIGSDHKLAQKLWKFRQSLDSFPLKFYPNRQRYPALFPLEWVPSTVSSRIKALDADVINLHWICDGFVPIEALVKINKPIVWTFHDMWGFTGGCCYSQECDRYTKSCGNCPLLGSNHWDLSRWVWQRKAKSWQDLNITIVTPSKWLAECVKSSSLFQNSDIRAIPNGLDIDTYKPCDRTEARDILNLPQNKQLILFGTINSTSNKRKGFHLLQPALKLLSNFEASQEWELVILGASEPREKLDLGLKTHYLGTLRDDASLALAYAAANVFVAPSTQDNLPNAVMEALACSTPCVAFEIGGMPDMIEHQKNGYLAEPYKIEDLAKGITWVLEDKQRWQILSSRAREKVEQEFTLEKQAHRYLSLFQLVKEKKSKNQNAKSK